MRTSKRRKANFAPVSKRRVRTTRPHSETVGIAVCGQSNSEQEPNFTHSQVGQSHAARVTPSVQAAKGSRSQHAPVTCAQPDSLQVAPPVHFCCALAHAPGVRSL